MTESAIRTEGLTRDFATVRALDDLTLEVPSGIVFGFLGPNGSGKTTLIHLLLGLLEPTRGRASVLGFDPRAQSADIRARTGVLLEHHGLYERLSAEANLDFAGRIARMPEAPRRDRIEQLLTHIDLWPRRAEPVGDWSRGMKQKLAVARALMARPRLLFLDEPTAGLDPLAAASLRDDLSRLVAGDGMTVFLTTHDLAEAEKLCARVAVIRDGHLLAAGSPAELRRRAGGQHAEITARISDVATIALMRSRPDVATVAEQDGVVIIALREGAEAAPVVSALVRAGAAVDEVGRRDADLEHAFLELVTAAPR